MSPEDDYFYVLLPYYFYILQSKKIHNCSLTDWNYFWTNSAKKGLWIGFFCDYLYFSDYLYHLSYQPVKSGVWVQSAKTVTWFVGCFSEEIRGVHFSEIASTTEKLQLATNAKGLFPWGLLCRAQTCALKSYIGKWSHIPPSNSSSQL